MAGDDEKLYAGRWVARLRGRVITQGVPRIKPIMQPILVSRKHLRLFLWRPIFH